VPENNIFNLILAELARADAKYHDDRMSLEELEASLLTLECEVMELRREVKRKNLRPDALRKEAVQVATMAVKFLRDCCGCLTMDSTIQSPPEPNLELSLRGQDWQAFSAQVLDHIENYTVPQYGDKGNDRATGYTTEQIADHIGRYKDRMGSNARGSVEAKRDLVKIAHYASLAYPLTK
jgi:hypothetical protein